jgi:Leucine-rich repeat (LRR) protein
VVPLRNLQELRLDDNDISMVTSDALTSDTVLRRLTLAGKIQIEELLSKYNAIG